MGEEKEEKREGKREDGERKQTLVTKTKGLVFLHSNANYF